MNYFVCVKGLDVATNLTKQQAINRVVKEHEKNPNLGGLEIGIGRKKYIKGELMYIMLPYVFFL
jgi:hypothetical protein